MFDHTIFKSTPLCYKAMEPDEDLQMVWSNFQANTSKLLADVQKSHAFSDVTLACDEFQLLPAHKIIISSGSSFFKTVLQELNTFTKPIVYLRGVGKEELEAVLTFLYTGQTRVHNISLDSFLGLARDLGIQGFTKELGQDQDTLKQTEFLESCHLQATFVAESDLDGKFDVIENNDMDKNFNFQRRN